MKKTTLKSILMLLVLLGLSNMVFAYVATIKETGEHYGTIQAAVDAALNNYTVILEPGEHHGMVRYENKNLTIASKYCNDMNSEWVETTIIDGHGVEFGIHAIGGLNLIGVTIRNCYGGAISANALNVESCRIYGNNSAQAAAVRCLSSHSAVTINNSYFANNTSDYSIQINHAPYLTISGCEFVGNNKGVLSISNSSNMQIYRNVFNSNVSFLHMISISDSHNIVIKDNEFELNDCSSILDLKNLAYVTLKLNTFYDNDATYIVKDVQNSTQLAISQCKFEENIAYTLIEHQPLYGNSLIVENSLFLNNDLFNELIYTTSAMFTSNYCTFYNNITSRSRYVIKANGVLLKNTISYNPDFESEVLALNTSLINVCLHNGERSVYRRIVEAVDVLEHAPNLSAVGRLIEGDPCIGAATSENANYYDVENVRFPYPASLGAFQTIEPSGLKSDGGRFSNVDAESEISVYPVPAADYITVSGVEQGTVVTVVDVRGMIVAEQTAENGSVMFNLIDIHAGVYYVQIESNGQIASKQFVLVR